MPVPFESWHDGAYSLRYGYHGTVLEDRERNGYDDSDFYAVVWDEYTNRPMNVEYASTRYACNVRSAGVDATPDIRARYEKWQREQAAEREARTIRKGKLVRVTNGRRKGVEGTVFWMGEDRFAPRRHGPDGPRMRVGVEPPEGERFFVNEVHLETVR